MSDEVTEFSHYDRSTTMRVEFTKGRDRDFILAHRSDGTIAQTTFPKKGLFPHDAIHFVVESELRYVAGFWGRVFAGVSPEEVGALAKAGGHHSASRAEQPLAEVVELIQAERIVECFEAEIWGEPADAATFQGVLAAACSQSRVPSPILGDENIRRIREQLNRLVAQWEKLPIGDSIVLAWGAGVCAS